MSPSPAAKSMAHTKLVVRLFGEYIKTSFDEANRSVAALVCNSSDGA